MSEGDEGWSDWMIWCDRHDSFHEDVEIQDHEFGPACGPDDWRRVFIEPRWYRTKTGKILTDDDVSHLKGRALPGSALIPPPGYEKEQ